MRITVKVGTSTLAHATGRLNIQRMEALCKGLSDLKNAGHEIILVSSGAIGMGVGKLNLPGRPADMPTKQAAAAVGQCELMYTYDKLFNEYNHTVAQVLLTGEDVRSEQRSRNMRNTIFRLLELGFSWTCDGELVCVHDWNAFYGRILDTDSPTLAQFEAVRDSTYGFTSLTLDHLIAWLREHPGVSIVTDIKEDCAAGAALIAQRCPDLRSRFIIQIYHPEEYDQVADLGFEHIILTVYQMSWSEKQDTAALVRFAAEHPLEGITFPAELADTPGYVEALLEAQVPLFVHTVNDPADQAALVRQGISGIYTDLGAPAPQE